MPCVDEVVEQQEISYIASGNAKWYIATLKNNIEVPYKIKHTFTTQQFHFKAQAK